MLKPTEQVNRGFAAQYYSQNFFRIDSNKSNMYKPEDVGFSGYKATIQIAKTKTAFIGSTIDVCFNGSIGFDPVFSLYEYAKSLGIIDGRNPFLYLSFVILNYISYWYKIVFFIYHQLVYSYIIILLNTYQDIFYY